MNSKTNRGDEITSQIVKIPYDDQEIGQGYNFETREAVGTGLSVSNISEDKIADGQRETITFNRVDTQDSLMESLGISTSLDVRYGLFSGGAKMDFANSHSVNSFSSYIAARCVVQNATKKGHGFETTPEAQALLNVNKKDDFKKAFGNMFVRSIKTGGELCIIVCITSVSEEIHSKLSASLSAEYNGLVASGTFKTDFNQAMEETHNQSEMHVFMYQAGGIGDKIAYTGQDAAEIIKRLKEFPQLVRDHPVGYEVEAATYDTIPIETPGIWTIEALDMVLKDCLAQKNRFLKALADLQFVSSNGALYFEDLPSQDELANMEAEYQRALNALMAHAIKVSTGQMSPPEVFIAPPLKPTNFKRKRFQIENAKTPEDSFYVVADPLRDLGDAQDPLRVKHLQHRLNKEIQG